MAKRRNISSELNAENFETFSIDDLDVLTASAHPAHVDAVVLLGAPEDEYIDFDAPVVGIPHGTDDLETFPINNPAYNIVFSYTDGNTSYSATADSAAAMWELIITADLPDIGGVDDLRIDSHLGLINDPDGTDGQGGTLANAGPRDLRANFIAYTGEMGIDPADAGNSALRAIIVHEIGHVLGIPFTGRNQGPSQTLGIENRWTGANAVAEYRILSNDASATYVRMQDDVGGQNGGHWNEGIFGLELMTPSIDTSQFAPLSRMTIGALRDMGYTVDLGYADPFALGTTPTAFRDDRSGNYNTTATIGVNSSATGSVELVEDNDWFAVSLTGGTSYTFELNGSATGAGTLADPFLTLRAADGEVLASNNNNGTNANSRISFSATSSGQYFLDTSAAGTGTGTYTVTTAIGGSPALSVSINDVSVTEGDSGTKVLTFTATRGGGTAAFAVNYATANDTAAAGSDYVAKSGTLSFGSGVNTQTISITINGDTANEPNETFFVNLSGATNGAIISDNQGIGTIQNDDPVTDDFADSFTDSTAPFGLVSVGGSATGNLETTADHDWFRVTLTSGQTYTIWEQGSGSGNGTLADPHLRLHNPSGVEVASNDDFSGLDLQITYTATVSGTFYLNAGEFQDNSTGTYRVSVSGSNEPPVITSNGGGDTATVARSENGTAVTTVTSTDPQGTPRTYSIVGGVDGARFQINATSGVLSFIAAPNFEAPTDTDANNSYVVQVRASDGSLFDTQTITVNVTNVNEFAPVITSNGGGATATKSVAENTTAVTTVTATDADLTTPTYAIVGGADAAKFQINAATGVLRLIAAPNFEAPTDTGANNSYVVQVRASDGSLFDTQTITVNVTDAKEQRGDFDADGNADILFHNVNGAVSMTLMNGFTPKASGSVGTYDPAWKIAGVADFDGDAKSDLLWRHTNGSLQLTELDGFAVKAQMSLGTASTAWKIVNASDFDGDGKGDILWRHTDGTLLLSLMDGFATKAQATIGSAGGAWQIASTGDFDGDGKADILYRANNGALG